MIGKKFKDLVEIYSFIRNNHYSYIVYIGTEELSNGKTIEHYQALKDIRNSKYLPYYEAGEFYFTNSQEAGKIISGAFSDNDNSLLHFDS